MTRCGSDSWDLTKSLGAGPELPTPQLASDARSQPPSAARCNECPNAYEREQITIAPPENAGSIIRRLGEATATPAAVDVHVVTNRRFMNTTEYVVKKANWGKPGSLPPSCGDSSPSRPGVEDACETWSTSIGNSRSHQCSSAGEPTVART
jgi:hypothetical protein